MIYFLNVDVGVTVFVGCVGVVLAVNGEAVEGRNNIMSNNCVLNRSQKRCFTPFCFICILLPLLC